MRGSHDQMNHMFSYLSPEQRVRTDHPLRLIRAMTDRVFADLSPRLTKMYSDIGRPSIPPEQLLRALLIQSRADDPAAPGVPEVTGLEFAEVVFERVEGHAFHGDAPGVVSVPHEAEHSVQMILPVRVRTSGLVPRRVELA
jgi:hypothetical protein